MRKLPLLLVFVALGTCCVLRGQRFDLTSGRLPVASLDGLWRFHTGDNPAWADPSFDDSGWPLLRSDEDWAVQGYKGYSGMAWYRFRVTLPAGLNEVSISLPQIRTTCEIYANGKRIGAIGKMPPNAVPVNPNLSQIYAIPREVAPGRDIIFAIRVWQWNGWVRFFGGGPQSGGSWIGETKQVSTLNKQARAYVELSTASYFILSLLQTLGAFAAVGLFLLQRREREYLWFALILAFSAVAGWATLAVQITTSDVIPVSELLDVSKYACVPLAQLAFYSRLLQTRRSWFYWASVVCLVVSAVSPLFLHPGHAMEAYQWNIWIAVLALPSYLWTLSVIFTRAWQNVTDARVLLLPAALQVAVSLLEQWSWIAFFLGLPGSSHEAMSVNWVFPIQIEQLTELLFLFAVLGILIHRFARTRGLQESYAREMGAAREVQQYLIPAHLPPTPGLVIESVYLPAREVGGDFFQVLPYGADCSVLIVVGDVAGKGLQAGMLATLIVGAIRIAAIFTADPGKILALLNERLQGRGLVTCVALRIEHDGAALLANAGHLPPYLNGKELLMEGALPLGAVPGIEFPVVRFQLATGDSLMLMSDGIAEAQATDGRLFGFERIGEMLRDRASAATLAAAAQDFGQADDITVLTVARMTQAGPSIP